VADTILNITTQNAIGKPLSIEVTAERDTQTTGTKRVDVLKVTLIADGDPVGVIAFDPTNDTLYLSNMSLSVANYTNCLVACGLGHLVSEILDCRRRGHTSVVDLIDCLMKKGYRLSLNLINCAVGCLASLP
jgi:hypothetical protein